DESGLNLILEFTRTSGVKVIAISGGGGQGDRDFLESAETFGAWRVNKPFDESNCCQPSPMPVEIECTILRPLVVAREVERHATGPRTSRKARARKVAQRRALQPECARGAGNGCATGVGRAACLRGRTLVQFQGHPVG